MPTATAADKTIAPKPVPVPNGDFYQLVDFKHPRRERSKSELYGDQGPADHQQVLVR